MRQFLDIVAIGEDPGWDSLGGEAVQLGGLRRDSGSSLLGRQVRWRGLLLGGLLSGLGSVGLLRAIGGLRRARRMWRGRDSFALGGLPLRGVLLRGKLLSGD